MKINGHSQERSIPQAKSRIHSFVCRLIDFLLILTPQHGCRDPVSLPVHIMRNDIAMSEIFSFTLPIWKVYPVHILVAYAYWHLLYLTMRYCLEHFWYSIFGCDFTVSLMPQSSLGLLSEFITMSSTQQPKSGESLGKVTPGLFTATYLLIFPISAMSVSNE